MCGQARTLAQDGSIVPGAQKEQEHDTRCGGKRERLPLQAAAQELPVADGDTHASQDYQLDQKAQCERLERFLGGASKRSRLPAHNDATQSGPEQKPGPRAAAHGSLQPLEYQCGDRQTREGPDQALGTE